jgi:hypothetical protein
MKNKLKIINWRLPTLKELTNIINYENFISLEAIDKKECFLWTSELTNPSSCDNKYNTFDIINKIQGSEVDTNKNIYALLVADTIDNNIIIYNRSHKFSQPMLYTDVIKRINAINLNHAIENLSNYNKQELHLMKIGEKSSELNHRIFQTMNNNNKKNLEYDSNILDGIADTLNSIEVYLKAIKIDKSELSMYRLIQIKKHL